MGNSEAIAVQTQAKGKYDNWSDLSYLHDLTAVFLDEEKFTMYHRGVHYCILLRGGGWQHRVFGCKARQQHTRVDPRFVMSAADSILTFHTYDDDFYNEPMAQVIHDRYEIIVCGYKFEGSAEIGQFANGRDVVFVSEYFWNFFIKVLNLLDENTFFPYPESREIRERLLTEAAEQEEERKREKEEERRVEGFNLRAESTAELVARIRASASGLD